MVSIRTLLLGFALFLLLGNIDARADDELCYQNPAGGTVTLTIQPCPITDNESFHYVYYTDLKGEKGGGCYIASDGMVLVIWENHPRVVFPANEFKSCYTM